MDLIIEEFRILINLVHIWKLTMLLKSFKDMGTWTKIYLDDASFDIAENYQDFLNRIKQYK